MVFRILKKNKKLYLKIFTAVFCCWLATLAAAPWILSKGLFQKQVNKHLNGSIEFNRVKLSWFKPQFFEGVVIKDKSNHTIATIESLKTTASLFQILAGKRDFKDVYVEKMTTSIFSGKTRVDNFIKVKQPLNWVHQEENQNRVSPIYVFKKPIAGNFHFEGSKLEIQSNEHDTIYFNDIQISCDLSKDNQPVIAQISCETAQNALSGSLNMKLEIGGFNDKKQIIFTPFDREIFFLSPQGYVDISAQVTNLPSAGLDHILNLIHKDSGPLFSQATGDSITLNTHVHVIKDKSSIHFTAKAHDLDVQLSAAIQQNQFFLTEPSICRLNIRPSLIAAVSKLVSKEAQLSIEQPSSLMIKLDRLSTPLDLNHFNFNNLSCNAQFTLTPLKFCGNTLASDLEIKSIQGIVDTFDLTDNLSLYLLASAYNQKKPFQIQINGELKKLINDKNAVIGLDKVHANFVAQTKNLPSKLPLYFFKNSQMAKEILGPSLDLQATYKGSLDLADINLDIRSSRLKIENLALKLHERNFTTSNEASLKFRATPSFAKKLLTSQFTLLHPFSMDGNIQNLNMHLHEGKFHLRDIDLSLAASDFECLYLDYKPIHVQSSHLLVKSGLSEKLNIQLCSNITLPQDLNTFNLDKKLQLSLDLQDLYSYYKGSPTLLQTQLTSDNWETQFNAYLDRSGSVDILQEAHVQLKDMLIPYQSLSLFIDQADLYIHPCKLSLAALALDKQALEGIFIIPNLSLQVKEHEETIQQLSVPFKFDGPMNQCSINATAKSFIDRCCLTASNFIKNKQIHLDQAKYNLDLHLYQFPTEILSFALPQHYDLNALIGPNLSIKLQSNFDKLDCWSGFTQFDIQTQILNSKGCLSFGDSLNTGDLGIEVGYFISPTSFTALHRAIQPDKDLEVLLKEPINLSAKVSNFSISRSGLNQDMTLSFDGQLKMDQFVTQKGGISDIIGSFNSSNLHQNLKFNFSASTVSNNQKGIAYFSAELTEPFDAQKKAINSQINGSINCQLKHFPTAVLYDLSHAYKFNIPYFDILGSTFNLSSSANLSQGEGPVLVELESERLRTCASLNFSKNALKLEDDLHVSFHQAQESDQLNEIKTLQSSNLLLHKPLALTIYKDNFSLPTSPFKLSDVRVDKAVLQADALSFENTPFLNMLCKFLKTPIQKRAILFSSPVEFTIEKGILKTQRIDFLINNDTHLAAWGSLDLHKQKGLYYLAIPQKVLQEKFNHKNLPHNYLFQIPVSTQGREWSVDWATATTQLCMLSMAQSSSKNLKQVNAPFLDIFIQSQPSAEIPKNSHQLPWEDKKLDPQPTDENPSHFLHQFLKNIRSKIQK